MAKYPTCPLTLNATASLAVSSRCESISPEKGVGNPNLPKSQRGREAGVSEVVIVAVFELQEPDDGADGGGDDGATNNEAEVAKNRVMARVKDRGRGMGHGEGESRRFFGGP